MDDNQRRDEGMTQRRKVLGDEWVDKSLKNRNAFNTDGLPTYGYKLVANYASAYPWGHAFSEADEGDTQAVGFEFTWPYRPVLQRWTGNGVLTSFNLAYTIAEDSADNIVVAVDGVPLIYAAGAPAAGQFGITPGTPDLLVVGTAPVNAGKMVALYGRT